MPEPLMPCTSIEALVGLTRRHGVSRRAVRALAHAGLLDIYRIRRSYYANAGKFAECVAKHADLIARVDRAPRSLPVQLLAALPDGERTSDYIQRLVAAERKRRATRKPRTPSKTQTQTPKETT